MPLQPFDYCLTTFDDRLTAYTTASPPLRATSSCRTSRRCSSGSFPRKKPRAYARSFFLKLISAATYSPTNTLRSTIGEGGLNCRVRHGTGCVPSSVTTRNLYCPQNQVNKDFMRLRPRCISIGQLNGRYPLTPPTYQTGSLPDTLLASAMGYLILRPASRLDAFSGYPIRTWLPGLCSWRNNRFTSGPSIPVLSY